jgi:hypothetical protein
LAISGTDVAQDPGKAWTLFEILDVLHQHEEDEWTRFGRVRARYEQREAVQTPGKRRRAKLTGSSKKA